MNRGWASSLYGCRAERSRCGSANNSCALTGLQSTENRIKWRRKPQDKEDELRVTGCGITCIINVTEKKSSSTPPPGVEYIHIPVSDTPGSRLNDHFDEVADKVQITAERSGRTLVHCNAGVSRSAALCMAYLMKHRGVTLLEAHGWLRTCRPVARPNNGFWKQLVQYEKELRGCNSVHMVSSSMGEISDIYEEEARNMMPL